MSKRSVEDEWMFLHADLMEHKPKVRAALLQKMKKFFCFGCGRDNQNDYCRCGTPAKA